MAANLLNAGFSVIAYATFLDRENRDQFCAVAEKSNWPFLIIHCSAAKACLQTRIQRRALVEADSSDATVDLLDKQNQQPRSKLTGYMQ